MSVFTPSTVMPALGAGIHDLPRLEKVVDGRAEPEHDALACAAAGIATPEVKR